jgi:hypothetical protein
MKLDEQVFKALEEFASDLEKGKYLFHWEGDGSWVKLFNEDIDARLHASRSDDNLLLVGFHVKDYRGQLDLQFWVEENRFIIFEMLEKMIWWLYQELQNNDPVSFTYGFDADHNSAEYIGFTVRCSDYMS